MSQGEARTGDSLTVDVLDQSIRKLAEQGPDRAIADLTAVANRAVIELHKLARQEATRRRGEADWGSWARLANAARSGVLQVAAIRDSVKGLPVAQPPEVTDKEEAAE
jgi:hypothetical protein